jgi:hypothetical protein
MDYYFEAERTNHKNPFLMNSFESKFWKINAVGFDWGVFGACSNTDKRWTD